MESKINERAIVALMMASQESAEKGFLECESSDFYDADCKRIFAAMEVMNAANKPIDLISVSSMFDKDYTAKIAEIYSEFYIEANLDVYISNLKKASKLRKFQEGLRNCMKQATDGNEDCYLNMQNLLDELNAVKSTDVTLIRDCIPEALNDLTNPQKGIPTGYPSLDKYIKGFVKGNLIVIAGRPSMGKSALAENMALNAARQGRTVVLFSLEMKNVEIAQRLMYMNARVGEMEAKETGYGAKKLADSINDFDDLKLYSYDSGGLNVSKMQSIVKRVKKKEKALDLVIVDYIGLVQTIQRKNSSRTQEVGEVAHALKQLAQEQNCTVIALAQLNRGVEQRAEHEPMLSDLRESGDIEQDADIVLFPVRPEVYDEDCSPNEAHLIIAKNRNGQTGKMELHWTGEWFLFDNPATDDQVEYAAARFTDVSGDTPFDEEE